MKKIIILIAIVVAISAAAAASLQNENNPTQMSNNPNIENCTQVEISTTMGDIVVALYNETPKHRDNFIKLVNEKFYDGITFHRVINQFMVQTGDPNTKDADNKKMPGEGDTNYTIDAEFVYPKYFHKRGALAAARQGDQVNPERKSSGSQFYIVTGKAYNEPTLEYMEQKLQHQFKQSLFNELSKPHMKDIMKMRMANDTIGMNNLRDSLVVEVEKEAAKRGVPSFTPEQKA
ncbi:MAG: peptidylprolyl isomerase, partial [Muribaculaceae bacterium]|nr:peptidylprolyl isomerase [Muribaculaceae bacterium]